MKILSHAFFVVLFSCSLLVAKDISPSKDKLKKVAPVHAIQNIEPKVPGSKVNHINVDQQVVALTFDDGPHAKLTPIVLDVLKKHQVKATFFVQGKSIKAYPEVARRAIAEGHELGNHTWSHAYLSKVSREKATDQLKRTSDIIESTTGQRPKVMRPPGGFVTAALADWVLSDLGMTSVMWDVDTNDWRRPGTAVIAQRAISGAKAGSFILVHDIHPASVAAVDAIVTGLKQRGFTLVTCSEMLAMGKARAEGVAPSLSNMEVVPMAVPVEGEMRPIQAPVGIPVPAVTPASKTAPQGIQRPKVPVPTPAATDEVPLAIPVSSVVPGAAQPSPIPVF